MKMRVAIYGGTELSAAESRFVESLTYSLLQTGNICVITGGFLSYNKNPGAISTDYSILEGARKYAKEKNNDLAEYLETWLPDPEAESDPTKREAVRFREGNVKQLPGESAQARRFLMVKDVDALITIKGKKHTAMVIDFALTINKPAFPIAFTGGDSLYYWNAHKERIRQWFEIDDDFMRGLQIEKAEVLSFPARDKLINRIVSAVLIALQKEKSNSEKYKTIQQQLGIHVNEEKQEVKNITNEIKTGEPQKLSENDQPRKAKFFLSYAHEDSELKTKLDKHLTALKRSNRISVWNDRELRGGDNWDDSIKEELRNADFILLLISDDFMNSDYIWENELRSALQRQESGLSKVVPIFLRECYFKGMPFEKLQGYPEDAKPVTSFSEREEDGVFTRIVKGISGDVEKWMTTSIVNRQSSVVSRQS